MNLLYITWDVSPEIFEIAGFAPRWYSVLFALGFVIGFFIVQSMFKKEKVDLELLNSLLMYVVVATVLGARLGHCLFYDWEYFSQHPLEILLPVQFEPEFRIIGFRGLASHGGAFGIIIALWLWSRKHSKKPLMWILDRLVVPSALAGAFIRLGNLMNSEIVGKVTDVDWAFIFVLLGPEPRHPVQLYEALAYLAIFAFLYWLYWKRNAGDKPGVLFGWFMILMFTARFFLEYYKRSQGGFETAFDNVLSTGQLLSIPFVLIGVFFLIRPSLKKG